MNDVASKLRQTCDGQRNCEVPLDWRLYWFSPYRTGSDLQEITVCLNFDSFVGLPIPFEHIRFISALDQYPVKNFTFGLFNEFVSIEFRLPGIFKVDFCNFFSFSKFISSVIYIYVITFK